MISADGLSTDPTKVRAIVDWPVPSNIRELHDFLRLAGYYQKFVRHFGIVAEPPKKSGPHASIIVSTDL